MKYGIHKTISQFSDAKAMLILTPENDGERLQLNAIESELKRLGISCSKLADNHEISIRVGIENDVKNND